MQDKALYFPYIEVPQNSWFVRILLYWENVGSIVPLEFWNSPERLSPYMRELVETRLVEQIPPGPFLYDFPEVGEVFLKYIEEAARRRAHPQEQQRSKRTVTIHIEKIERVGPGLVKLGLARRKMPEWYEVQEWVGRDFMTYLATVLAKHERVKAAPVTNDLKSLRALARTERPSPYRRRVGGIREVVLNQVLPSPRRVPPVAELASFKERHADKLGRLRAFVEQSCIEIASIENAEARTDRTEILQAQLRTQLQDVQEAMRTSWSDIVFGRLVPLLATPLTLDAAAQGLSAAGVGGGLTLVGAIYQAVSGLGPSREALRHPLAYAALAHQQFADPSG
jgi:hypothetical protein